jgi:hypothetical protein
VADKRVFQRLDFSGFSTTFIKWIVPQDTTRLLIILTTLFLTSCRCSTEFVPKPDNSADTTIQATAHMWQGQYEYLSVDIEIKRTDSLFVKDFFPEFIQYEMYSYYFEKDGKYKGGPYWKTYSAKDFEQLPADNRQTNKDKLFVKYTAFYHSDKQINFEEFTADIVVTLINQSGQEIKHKRKFDFYGERNCRFSAH